MADFYGSLPDALVYHADRGNAAWSATGVTDTQRSAALVRASVYIDGRYGRRYPGQKTGGRAQALGWPREGAKDCAGFNIADDVVPVEIEHAVYEAALVELTAAGSLSPTVTPGRVVTKEKVDVIEVEYGDHVVSADAMRPVHTIIDDILAPLLCSGVRYFGKVARA
ncbi:hypothetical protein FHS82_001051 [Pseudochelatococcus lubricantis]|uniref:Putative DnaT-like domain-containing protein n=1 Tax=Pseudochelatococcus lubricantis TaxID=1538102 RepID=A0ABX0UZB6_9HYPH|nr:DnaT-like ssDNA-binding protein [Pseudochelatococcus lubricantis]NIJ57225.1 hypothetical protein [Pseudochelatococcus lubricantis]